MRKKSTTSQKKRLLNVSVQKKHIREVVVYGLVGVSALVTQMLMYSLLCKLKMHPLWSNLIATNCGMFVSYYGHTRLTFQKTHHFSHKEFIKFFLTSSIGLGFTSGVIFIMINIFKLHSAFGLIPMTIAPVITFLVSKLWVFK